MKIKVTCDFCKTTLAVPAEKGGKKGRCPKCKEVISIPTVDASSAVPKKADRVSGSASNSTSESPPRRARRSKENAAEDSKAKRGAASRKKEKEPAVDDIWSQPLSSYSSPAIEEHEYELYGIEQKQSGSSGQNNPYRAQREVGTYSSYTAPNYKIPMIMAGVGLGSAVVLGGIGFAFPPAALAGAGIGGVLGFLLMLWGGLKILSNAFEDGPLTGVLYLMCGPYALYFTFSRWDVNQHPFIINLMGTVVFFLSMLVSALAGGGGGGN